MIISKYQLNPLWFMQRGQSKHHTRGKRLHPYTRLFSSFLYSIVMSSSFIFFPHLSGTRRHPTEAVKGTQHAVYTWSTESFRDSGVDKMSNLCGDCRADRVFESRGLEFMFSHFSDGMLYNFSKGISVEKHV